MRIVTTLHIGLDDRILFECGKQVKRQISHEVWEYAWREFRKRIQLARSIFFTICNEDR